MAGDNVYGFRRVKWADPDPRLKVLAEDLPVKGVSWRFVVIVAAVVVVAFTAVALGPLPV